MHQGMHSMQFIYNSAKPDSQETQFLFRFQYEKSNNRDLAFVLEYESHKGKIYLNSSPIIFLLFITYLQF